MSPLTPITPTSLAIGPNFTVTDGSTTVTRPSTVRFSGASVAESPTGTALVTVSGGSGVVQQVAKTVSAAEILAFDGNIGTDVQMIAAPGMGEAIIVISAVAVLTAGVTPFADGGDVYLGPRGLDRQLWEPCIAANYVRETTDQVGLLFEQQSNGPRASIENCPIVANVLSTPFSAGDGTLTIHLTYYVLTL